jgi:hypothetical protein
MNVFCIEKQIWENKGEIMTYMRTRLTAKIIGGFFLLIFVLCCSKVATAQSTLFNIPSTDTVAAKKGYAEFDFLPQAPGTGTSRTYLYNPRVIVGVPDNIEAGVNFPVYRYSSTGSSSFGYIQPNVKWRFYNDDKAGIAAAAGGVLNTPLNKRTGQDSWGYVYGLLSKKVKTGMYGPRVHGGVYGVVSANQDPAKGAVSFLGPRGGAILGYEQPVQSKITIVADWFSGKNGMGYFTPGVSITLPKSGLFNAGYSIGNDSFANSNATKNRYLFLYYGITFPGS